VTRIQWVKLHIPSSSVRPVSDHKHLTTWIMTRNCLQLTSRSGSVGHHVRPLWCGQSSSGLWLVLANVAITACLWFAYSRRPHSHDQGTGVIKADVLSWGQALYGQVPWSSMVIKLCGQALIKLFRRRQNFVQQFLCRSYTC